MYEVKNRIRNTFFSAAEFLDKIDAAMLNSNLYLRTIKINHKWGRGLYIVNPSGELIWIQI